MKSRTFLLVARVFPFAAAGAVYIIFVHLTGFGIPCVFNKVTGLYCPGCGITRMFVSLMRLDFRGALGSNAVALCALPFVAADLICRAFIYVRSGRQPRLTRFERIFLYALTAVFLVFCILRNLPSYAFLVPV